MNPAISTLSASPTIAASSSVRRLVVWLLSAGILAVVGAVGAVGAEAVGLAASFLDPASLRLLRTGLGAAVDMVL